MVDMESTTAHQLQTAEPIANASAIFEDISDTKPTDNMSSSVALLPPNDASIITLLAAQAQDDHELQAQLKSSTLIKPGGPIPPTGPFDEPTAIEDPTALTGLILGIHQRLQEHHGLPVDPTIYDPARDDSWRLELVTNWGVRVSQLQVSHWVSHRSQSIADCSSSPSPTSQARLWSSSTLSSALRETASLSHLHDYLSNYARRYIATP